MKLKKIFLLTSICAATFAATNIYAATSSISVQQHQLSNQDKLAIKAFIIENLDSLFPFQTQITVSNITQDSQGNMVASDILIMGGGKSKPNISINKLLLKGLELNEDIESNFSIIVEGLSVTNLASSIANSNVVSAEVDPKDLANNKGLFGIFMNSFSQGIYNFKIDYDYDNHTMEFQLNSTNNKKKFIQEDFELNNMDLSDVHVDSDFLAGLKNSALNSKLKELEFDADFSEVLKNVANQYFSKKYKQTPVFEIKGELGKAQGQLKLDIDSELGANSYFHNDVVIEGIDLANTKLRDIIDEYEKVLANAYLEKNTLNTNIELRFDKNDFPKKSPMRQIFKVLDRNTIDIVITSKRNYTGSQYDTDFNIKSNGLADMGANFQGTVDGKLSLLPYLNMSNDKVNDNLYNCKNQLCVTNLSFDFANYGLLEKIARYSNQDPNTTPKQILGSYSALLQLFSVQQKDPFLQKILSSFAMFFQNPKNITITAKANKPLNVNALMILLANDVQALKRQNPVRGGKVNLNTNHNLKLINNIQKLFAINFDVNK